MAKRRPPDLGDVEIVLLSISNECGRKKPLSRSSRKQEIRSGTVQLRYRPTGKQGRFEIPRGNYTKREMKRTIEATKLKFLKQIKGGKL